MSWVDGLILLLALIAAALFFGAPVLAAIIVHERRELFRWRHHDHLIPTTPRSPRDGR
ncbi:MAG: hypothetical protein V4537_16025 [Pseudomonadota bacterium]